MPSDRDNQAGRSADCQDVRIPEEAIVRVLEQGIHQITEGVVVVRDDQPEGLPIVFANRAFVDLLGRTPVEGEDYLATLPPVSADIARPLMAREATERRDDLVLRDERGHEYAVELSVFPVLNGDGPTHLILAHRNVTEQRQTEHALQDALARYMTVLDSTLDPLVTIDFNGTIQVASRSIERVFGWKPDELIGRNVNVLMPEPHRSRHDGYLAKYRATGRTEILGRAREFEAQRKDGSVFPIELSVWRVDIPGRDEPLFTGILRDVTERRSAEREVALVQDLALALGQAHDLNEAMSIALETICAETGWDYGEAWMPDARGERLRDTPVWHETDDRFTVFQSMTQGTSFAPGEGLPGRVWSAGEPEWLDDLTHEGGLFQRAEIASHAGFVAGVAFPILVEEEVVAVMAFFMRVRDSESEHLVRLVQAAVAPLGPVIKRRQAERELSDYRRRLEELVAERTSELEASHDQLRLADRLASIGTLAAGLGHDMNNVLLPLRSRLEVLDTAELPESMREHFEEVRRSTRYLQQLADGLHLLALDPDDSDASNEVTDLDAWWAQVGSLLARAVPRHARLATSWPSGLPSVLVAPHRLTQAVLNLLVNAGEAVGEDGRVRVWAEATDDGHSVRLVVADNGSGMPPEVRRRALDPFFTTKKRGLGTGLGLSLVQGVAKSAGGRLEIESEAGEGTIVRLTLPASATDAPPPAGTTEPGGVALLTIDDARLRSMIAALLQSNGFEVRQGEPRRFDTGTLWITDQAETARKAVESFVMRSGGRVIVLDSSAQDWSEPGVIVIEDPDDFERVRDTIIESMSHATGKGP